MFYVFNVEFPKHGSLFTAYAPNIHTDSTYIQTAHNRSAYGKSTMMTTVAGHNGAERHCQYCMI